MKKNYDTSLSISLESLSPSFHSLYSDSKGEIRGQHWPSWAPLSRRSAPCRDRASHRQQAPLWRWRHRLALSCHTDAWTVQRETVRWGCTRPPSSATATWRWRLCRCHRCACTDRLHRKRSVMTRLMARVVHVYFKPIKAPLWMTTQRLGTTTTLYVCTVLLFTMTAQFRSYPAQVETFFLYLPWLVLLLALWNNRFWLGLTCVHVV